MKRNMLSEKQYDELLYPILTSEGNITNFFDKIFDFLYRRTDYFKIKKDSSSKMGLEMGEAEKVVRSVFCKYIEQGVAQHKLEMLDKEEPVSLDYIAEEVVTTTETSPVRDIDTSADRVSNEISKAVYASNTDETDQQSDPKSSWNDPDSYNGARYDDYAWAQSLQDVDIRINVPKYVTIGKHVKVVIKRSFICTELYDGRSNLLKEGILRWPINVEESTWTLVPGEHIHVYLQKLQQRWWDSCFIGESKINLKCIDPSMPYEELDEESQAKINELMYNEQQKRLGKPTIPQTKVQNILKEAWDAEGSPFKGQPFDPSLVDVQNVNNL